MCGTTLCRCLVVVLAAVLASTPMVSAAERQAFVSSAKGSGNLGSWADANGQTGAAAGDAICQAAAAGASLPNASSYRAWLSTTSADAFCRIQGLSGTRSTLCGGMSSSDPAVGPWVRRDGEPFAARLAHMAGGEHAVYQPVFYDEYGAPLAELDNGPWTGTGPDGAAASSRCNDWISGTGPGYGVVGSGWRVGGDWTNFGANTCDIEYHLLCLEVGAGDPLVLGNAGGELAFVSSVSGTGDLSSWADSGGASGLAGGDAICQARAAAGGLPSPASFVAYLADATTDARERLGDGPFVRVDGFAIAGNKAAMYASGAALTTGINVTELGEYYVEPLLYSYVWTGTNTDGTSAAGFLCGDWSDDTLDGRVGSSASIRFTWTVNGSGNCAQVRPIYCFSTSGLLMWDNFERGDATRWSATAP